MDTHIGSSSTVESIILLDDVRLAARYAARAGLIADDMMLAPLRTADEDLHAGKTPESGALAKLLSRLVNLIHPVTLADLKEGRDPFEEHNQGKARMLRILLMVFSLFILLNIAYFVDSLRREQEALANIESLKDIKPVIMLAQLRSLAQSELPNARADTGKLLMEKYSKLREEYLHVNRQLGGFYQHTLDAANRPLFPFNVEAQAAPVAEAQDQGNLQQQPNAQPPANPAKKTGQIVAAMAGGSSGGNSGGAGAQNDSGDPDGLNCVESQGELVLPAWTKAYPPWMRTAFKETLTDYCFQIALGNGSTSSLLTDMDDAFGYSGVIGNKISLRVVWCLPVMFGMLGAAIFVMQNIANVRTPTMEWYGILMRITMGGIAGVAIGWFGAGDIAKLSSTSPVSAGFVLAFLVGYCIELLFRVLEKMSNGIIEGINKPPPERAGADGQTRTPAG